MALPLRLSLSFLKGETGEADFLHVFNRIGHIKLFHLELELDTLSYSVFLSSQPHITFNSFEKTLVTKDPELFPAFLDQKGYHTIFEIPFWLNCNETKELLKKLSLLHSNHTSLAYFITRQNLAQFSDILDFALKKGIKRVIIPNPDLVNYQELIKKSYLTPLDLDRLTFIHDYSKQINLQVHDYFLAKFLGLKDAELFKGCQAGELMGYIQNGTVYPCKSIPVVLGSLFEEDFDTIWKRASDVMKKFCSPEDCSECSDNKGCKQGCPGNAFFLNNGKKDPLCEK